MNETNETIQQAEAPVDAKALAAFDPAKMEYYDAASQELGLPSSGALQVLKKVAADLAGSPFCPSAFRGQPLAIYGAVLQGREMQLSLMQSLRAFWPSPDGRLGMYSQAMLAMMLRAKFKFEWHQNDAEMAEVTVTRPDGNTLKTSWGVTDTKRAQLESEKKQHGRYPVDMNMNRVIGRVFRFLGADLGGNGMYNEYEHEAFDDDQKQVEGAEARNRPYQTVEEFHVGRKPEVIEVTPEPLESQHGVVNTELRERVKEHFDKTPPEVVVAQAESLSTSGQPEQPNLKQHLEGMAADFIRKMGVSDQQGQGYIKEFLLAFLGVPNKPRDLSKWLPAFEKLEVILSDEATRVDFLRNRTLSGRNASGKSDQLEATVIGKWKFSTDVLGYAREIMVAYNYGDDASKFIDYAEAVGLDMMDEKEAVAYLPIAVVTNKAIKIQDIAKKYTVPLLAVINKLKDNLKLSPTRTWQDAGATEIQTQIDVIAKSLEVPPTPVREGTLPFRGPQQTKPESEEKKGIAKTGLLWD